MDNNKLTGKYYHKKTLLGLVLMVEVEAESEASMVLNIEPIYHVSYRKANELGLL